MNLSIVIVNWNTKVLLERCLDSILRESVQGGVEIFVVDNASTDGSAEMVRELFPQVHLIHNDENMGFARANNQAMRLATGHAVMLLNPDTEIKPGAFHPLLEFIASNSMAGAIGPRVLNPDASLQHSCSPRPTISREVMRLLHLPGVRSDGYYPMETWDPASPRRVETLLGACILLRREALAQVGMLDEEYFIYTEEVDLCARLNDAGWELYWVPAGEIIHYGGQSTQQVAQEMFLRLYESKLIYFRKHDGWMAAKIYKVVLGIAAIVRLTLMPLAFLEKPEQRSKHMKQAVNYKRLLQALPEM